MGRKDLVRRTIERANEQRRDAVAFCLERICDSGVADHYLGGITPYLDVADARVLDVGSGAAWHAPFLFAHGARAVHCIDKYVDPTTREMHSNPNGGEKFSIEQMPLTLGEFLGAFPDIELIVQDISGFADRDARYDASTLLTVSEHLIDVEKAFDSVARALKPKGRILVTHGNFFAWQGHHMAPYAVDRYDPTDDAQTQLADWNHVLNKDQFDTRFIALNLIRIHELAGILARHFEPIRVESLTAPPAVAKRLTPERRIKLFQYYEAELLTDLWIFVGRRNGQAVRNGHYHRTFRVSVRPDTYREGLCYIVPIPFGINPATYALYENDRRLPDGNCMHEDIRKFGNGRYSIWGHSLYFSTPDNTDPLVTGAVYELRPLTDAMEHDAASGN